MNTSRFTPSLFAAAPLFLSLFLVLLLAACADTSEPAEEPAETATEDPTAAPEATPSDMAGEVARVGVAEQAPYGQYLVDGEGRALYLFTADTQGEGRSTCDEACAAAWPPLLTGGDPAAGAPSVDTTMLGTIGRQDGATQVTYNGWPLYYYREDTGAGMVTGQDVHGFGGEWYLVSPQGQQVEAEAEGDA